MYRGRIAPSPTGYLHLGHARTFWTAQERALATGGTLVLRNEDLDAGRCRDEYVKAMIEDLQWIGLRWQEGPDCGGPYAPYSQSERKELYRAAFEKLRVAGCIYPCYCSRKEILASLQAPHASDEEPIYPGTCRPVPGVSTIPPADFHVNWRFRIPEGKAISFNDGYCGQQEFQAGCDFGDFVVWRHDNTASYQLAVVVDDVAMEITEVVRGADLLLSTARQLLIYRALGFTPPAFYHCPLVTDESGVRLAKRHDAMSLRTLRAQGRWPENCDNCGKLGNPI